MRVAGIMSGTSLDGIDVAVVDISGRKWKLIAADFTPYPPEVREAILSVSNANTHTASIARLHFLLGDLYAEAVAKHKGIELVGCHGQTIFHESTPVRIAGRQVRSTLQIGEASLIAERLSVPVVSDFRPRDIAAGGTGAPLVPYVDYFLYRHPKRRRAALNIGGIANVTYIPAKAKPEDVIAFDTGPGNMIVDALAERATQGKLKYDKDGRLAKRGRLNPALLDQLLRDPFIQSKPPKSAGREQYGKEFVERLLKTGEPIENLIATATALTAAAVAHSVARFTGPVDDLIVSGGGAHNPMMMAYLAAFLPDSLVTTSAAFGVDIDAKEAIAFAILAYETWRKRPSNLPSATGARHPVILGKITF